MNPPLVECVPNLAEGRDPRRVAALLASVEALPGVTVLHVTSDADHNRSVFTLAGPPGAMLEAAVRLARKASEVIDLRTQTGVHPRLGALDVLPFVPLAGSTLDDCIDLAHQAGRRIWNEVGLPIYFYEAAALRPDRRKLEDVRRGQFEGLRLAIATDPSKQPDLGGPALHESAGAVIAGARKFLIAFNINLQSPHLDLAKAIARSIRTSSGGLPHVKALGLPLASRGLVQVSTNLTDFEVTPILQVYSAVARLAKEAGVAIAESELIGLAPRAALTPEVAAAVRLQDFTPERIVENRLF